MRILHCSDVHVTQDYAGIPLYQLGWRRSIALLELSLRGRAVAYAQAAEVLSQIAQDAERLRADHLIISGDITAYAMEREFSGARAALGKMADDPRRCTVIPGNHDFYTPFAVREKLFERYFGHLLHSDLPEFQVDRGFPFVRMLPDAAIIGLCSARVPPVPGLSFGIVGKKQLAALERVVSDPRLLGRAVIVVVHHAPLNRQGKADRRSHGLLDAKPLASLLKGERFAVLHGHIHARYHHPATEERPHFFGAGSSTCRGMEGYWLLEISGGKIQASQKLRPGAPAPLATTP